MGNTTETFESKIEKKRGGCRSCHLNCPVWVTVKDGRAVKVEGDPAFGAPNFGKVCVRAEQSPQWVYSPTRVRYPMKRAGKRGEGKWERISWDQACEEIAEKTHKLIEKYGGETIVLPGRTGRHDMGWTAHKFGRMFNSPNCYYGPIQVCYVPESYEQIIYGSYTATGGGAAPTGLFVCFSTELAYSWPIYAQGIAENVANGMKLIVVDPVQGPIASKADEWVPIRPGTDLAWCMGIIRYLLANGLYDEQFVKQWSNATFLIHQNTGALLTEADIKKDGSPDRYMFWDEGENRVKYWDAKEVQWEGGPSGKAHYDKLCEQVERGKTSNEVSPAAAIPESVKPALFGEYEVEIEGFTGKMMPIKCKTAFQQLWENVEAFTPEYVEGITGVPAAQTERCAEMIGTTHPCDIAQGLQYMSTNQAQYVCAVNIIKTITGNVENDGGSIMTQFYPVTPQMFPSEYHCSFADGLPLEQKRKRLGYYEHRVGCGWSWEECQKWQPQRPSNADGMLIFPDLSCVLEAAETGKPYEVHAIYAISSNWLMHDPTPGRWLPLLEDETKIQLHVVTEIVMSPTAELADYVLPAQTWMERNYMSFGLLGEGPIKGMFGRVIEPLCEARHDYDFGALLSKYMGKYDKKYTEGLLNSEWSESKFWGGEYGKFWPADDIDGFREIICQKYLEMSFEKAIELGNVAVPHMDWAPPYNRQYVAGKFPTDTGKIDLFNTIQQKAGYPALPVYTEPYESPVSRPELAEEYPLVFSGGKRQPGFFHSEYRQVPYAREMTRTPDVFINPETAHQYGVDEGDWIWIESPADRGRAPYNRIMGKVSFRLMNAPGIVTYSQHAWWRPEFDSNDPVHPLHGALEWNAECLVEVKNVTPETGAGGYRSQMCKIYKCTPEEIAKYEPDITDETIKEKFMPMTEEEINR